MNPFLDPLLPLPEQPLLGLSGGIDSVTLLDALLEAGKRPVLLHFDHGWRNESGDDAHFVRALGKERGLRVIVAKAPAVTPRNETAARAARYAFFARAAKRLALPDLVLAHHADDQVETFLLQLFRGSGSGWSGMECGTVRGPLRIHRPWLGLWRKEIVARAAARHLAWREDTTNHDPAHFRNAIRHHLLPLLETETGLGKALGPRFLRTATLQRDTQTWIDTLVAPLADAERLAVAVVAAQPLPLQRRLLHLWLKKQGVADLSFDDVEAARGLVSRIRPAKINLSRGRHLRRQAGVLFVTAATAD
ncbi:tRNA(Ile)-lysidine synthase [Verrucomicrobium sp. GAS474]|uniref:tRNA lysidine(34) synthetase TilS n=1 Tax=Verrucomicrobium sp. GAS474 TaxID=1882831 RepID=UPI00087C35F6|nr:tRNA lysidine(34) synthetase TilS [Verrucomicrobium sp. GAS474]SDU16473.1 tRNA(Ile)-lysidine synthase [Verrucomicrobium sp. GAS474]